MERYKSLFTQLKERKESVFVPFITLDDPGIEQSLKIINMPIEAGVDALESGIPFFDSLADGPTIQNATLRAFAVGVTLAQCSEVLALIHQKHPTIPIDLLVHANLMSNKGVDRFYAEYEKVGADSVLIIDVPVEESASFRQAALRYNAAPISVCPPNVDDDLLCQIASYDRGYTYLLPRAGATGTEDCTALPLNHLVARLKEHNVAPPLQGFGIFAPDQVKAAIDVEVAGVIPDSAIVRIIGQYINEPKKMLTVLKALVQPIKAATRS